MKKRNLFQRTMAFMLALILAVPAGIGGTPVTAHAAETEGSGISIGLAWEDHPDFKNGTSYALYENEDVENTVKMKVSYECSETREEGYNAGELIISVKGIGKVNRSGVLSATVGADPLSSAEKTRDWSYTWNKANDTYTFTNNEAIPGNSVFSGYFELVWVIDARESVHGYTQSGMKAVLYLPDGKNLSSGTLSFSNKTKADDFEVYIEQGVMYSYEGLTGNISNPNDYAFVRYNLGASDFENSRGLKSHYYLFDPDVHNTGSGAIVISPKLSCENMGDGTYKVKISSDPTMEMEDQYIFAAYPRNAYTEKTTTASIAKYGAYYEGDDSGNTGTVQLAVDTVDVKIPNDFDFTDIPGVIYQFYKDTYYDKHVRSEVTQAQGGDMAGVNMTRGTEQTFYLEGPLNNPDGVNYTLEVVDDFFYIRKNSTEYRQLTAEEYTFTSITIPGTPSLVNTNGVPIQSDVYPVSVYIASNGTVIDPKAGTPVWSGVITGASQTVDLTRFSDNISAIGIVMYDLAESVDYWIIPVKVKFDTKDTSSLGKDEQDNLTSGEVVNTTFIRVYAKSEGGTYSWKDHDGKYIWINDDFSEENYLDDTNLGLAAKDKQLYGGGVYYLDRERDNITFYEAPKNDYRAYTDLASIEAKGNKFVTTFTMGANFTFKGDEYPNKFSLYTILDESLSLDGYRYTEDIWDIMTLYSDETSETELAAACTPEIIQNYNGSGRTYIALHFDFGSTQVPQNNNLRAAFRVKVNPEYLKQSTTIRGRSAVVIDREIDEYPLYKVKDSGTWGDNAALWADIDRDGNTEETLTSNFDYVSYVYADSSQLQLTKYVQTTYSDDWVQLPEVPPEEFGGIYQYSLYLKNGKSQATDIIVRDILEVGENAQWQGTFQSVDLSKCAIPGTVYYSAKENPSDSLNTSDWSASKPETVKAIAVNFGDSVLEEGETLRIIVNMKAPEDVSLKNKVTENGYSASFTMMDSETGNITGSSALASNFVQVKLTPALKSVIITKTDAESGINLKDAVFALYEIGADGKATGEPVAEATSNAKGYAIFRNIPADTSYILRETSAPYGYEAVQDRKIDMNGTDQRLVIEDPRKTGKIEVRKVNNLDNDIPVEGAAYSLYDQSGNVAKDADGNDVQPAITNKDGLAVFENLPWGTYVVKETATPAGYLLNETGYTLCISRSNVSEIQVVHTADVQEDVSVKLSKYVATVSGEKTSIPLGGVSFKLMRRAGETDESVGLYVTDLDGVIEVIELPYGEYYFQEYRTPAGYQAAEDAEFTLSPDNKQIQVSVYNQRKPGSLTVIKKDNLGNMLEGIEFTLYPKDEATGKPAEVSLAKGKTDEYGVAKFTDLEWGTYFVQETNAPDYYQMDTEPKEFTVGAENLDVNLEVVNETVKGAILLTKTDEEGIHFLSGAEYTLYMNDGTVVDTFTTVGQETVVGDGIVLEKGQLIAQDLEWGTYYFKETKAPNGYGLSDETIRFSVNAQNAGLIQYVDATDPLDAKSITLIKKIYAEDVNFDNGDPTFLFKVEGTDVSGNSHTYYRSVTFDEAYVRNCIESQTDSNGYVSLSTTIGDLVAGTYTATEEETSRYYLSGISDAVNGEIAGDTVTFNLSSSSVHNGSAVFTNRNYEQQDFSDAQILTNILKQKRRLTALKVTYGETTAKAEAAINTNILEVIALYDDGSAETLTENQYVLTAEDKVVTNFPNQNGDYTIRVSYTDNGVTRSDTFTVTLSGMKIRIIELKASVIGDSTLKVGSAITADMFNVIAVYNNGTQKTLAGNEFTVTPTIVENGDEFTVDIALNLAVIPNDGYEVGTSVSMTGKYTAILETGSEFNQHLPNTATTVSFIDTGAPAGVSTIDVSAEKNGSVVAWLDGTTFYVTARDAGEKVVANQDCSYMFKYKNLTSILFNDNFVTSNAVDMTEMFDGIRATELDVSSFDTSNVVSMTAMFENCYYLTTLDISSFDTSKVERMNAMFQYTNMESITFGDKWTMENVKVAGMMFGGSESLKSLDVSKWDTSKLEFAHDMFSNCVSLTELDVSNWDTSNIHDMESMFSGCTNLKHLDLSKWDTRRVHNMNSMFEECESLTELDLTSFDTRRVSDTNYMFDGCSNLKTIYVTDTWYVPENSSSMIFWGCYSLVGGEGTAYTGSQYSAIYAKIDGGKDNPGLLTGISMNYGLVGIGKTVTPTVKKQGVFSDYTITGYQLVSGNQYAQINASTGALTGVASGEAVVRMTAKGTGGRVITSEKTVYIGETTYAVYSADDQSLTFLRSSDAILKGQTYNDKTVTAVYTGIETTEYTYDMLSGISTAPWCADGSGAKVLKVVFEDKIAPTSIAGWFSGFKNITSIDLSNLDTSNVTSMSGLFYDCRKLENIIFGDNWTTAKVREMNHMFYYCQKLASVDVKRFDTSNVMDMSYMFARCNALTSLDLTGWDVSRVFNMSYMFLYCEGLTEMDMSKWNWNISSIENMECMFQYCRGLTSITFDEDWNTPKLKNMVYTFYECEKLTQIDFGGLDTSNVEDASRLFAYCESLTNLDLSELDVTKLQTTSGMFSGCTDLVTVDLSTWNTKNVTDMSGMFSRCTSLTTVFVSDSWSTAKVNSSGSMFYSCTNLVGGKGTVYNESYTAAERAKIDGGTQNPGYFTDVADKPGE